MSKSRAFFSKICLQFLFIAIALAPTIELSAARNTSSLNLGGQVRSENSPVKRYNPLYLEGSIGVYGQDFFNSAELNFEFDARSESSKENPHLWYLHQAEVQSKKYINGKVHLNAGRFIFTDINQYSLVDGLKVTYTPSPRWQIMPVMGALHSPEEALVTNEAIPWGGVVVRYQSSGNTLVNAIQAKHPREGLPLYFFDHRFTRYFGTSPYQFVFYGIEVSPEHEKLEQGEAGLSQGFIDDSAVFQGGYRYVNTYTTLYQRREELFHYLVNGTAKQSYVKGFLPKEQVGINVLRSSISDLEDVYYLSDIWWQDFAHLGSLADLSLQVGVISQKEDNLKYGSLIVAKKRPSLDWQLKYEIDTLKKINDISGTVHAVELATKHKISEEVSAKLSVLGESNLDAKFDLSFLLILGYLDPL